MADKATAQDGIVSKVDDWNLEARSLHLKSLEEEALRALKVTIDSFSHPTFPCALIAGDVVRYHSNSLLFHHPQLARL